MSTVTFSASAPASSGAPSSASSGVIEDTAAVHARAVRLIQDMENLNVRLDSANRMAIAARQDTNKSIMYLSGAAALISTGLFIYLFRQKPR